jgi:hypothetical protein
MATNKNNTNLQSLINRKNQTSSSSEDSSDESSSSPGKPENTNLPKNIEKEHSESNSSDDSTESDEEISQHTWEKADATKFAIEDFYENFFKHLRERQNRYISCKRFFFDLWY